MVNPFSSLRAGNVPTAAVNVHDAVRLACLITAVNGRGREGCEDAAKRQLRSRLAELAVGSAGLDWYVALGWRRARR